MRSLLPALALTLWPAPLVGDEVRWAPIDAGVRDAASTVRPYQGVALDNDRLPPRPPPPASSPTRLIWTGFQVREGVPTIFLEMTRPASWNVVEKGNRITYRLKAVKVPLRNNRRQLEAVDFGTAVKRVRLLPRSGDLQLIIDLAHPLSHRERFQPAPGGYAMFVVELI